MENKTWIVTTSGERPLTDIREELTQKGFKVQNVLEAIGCIVGTAPEAVVSEAAKITGVSDISPDQPVDIGPPGADIS